VWFISQRFPTGISGRGRWLGAMGYLAGFAV